MADVSDVVEVLEVIQSQQAEISDYLNDTPNIIRMNMDMDINTEILISRNGDCEDAQNEIISLERKIDELCQQIHQNSEADQKILLLERKLDELYQSQDQNNVNKQWESDFIDFKRYISGEIATLKDTVQSPAINGDTEKDLLKSEISRLQTELKDSRGLIMDLVKQVCVNNIDKNILVENKNESLVENNNKRRNHSSGTQQHSNKIDLRIR